MVIVKLLKHSDKHPDLEFVHFPIVTKGIIFDKKGTTVSIKPSVFGLDVRTNADKYYLFKIGDECEVINE